MDNLLETLERSAACSVEFFIWIFLPISIFFPHTGLCICMHYKENSYNNDGNFYFNKSPHKKIL